MKQLPFIRVANREAVCGFALRALLSERLLGADPAQRFVQAHQNQARLMALVARWQHPLTLELHMTARPSLDSAVMGNVRLAVVARVSGATREEALERCLGCALSLRALFAAFLPQAEFSPLEDPPELEAALHPFTPTAWMAITRRREVLPLASRLAIAGGPLGFEGRAPTPAACDAIDHLYPWVPVPDDWCALADTWLAYPAPLWMVARFSNGVEAASPEPAITACEQILANAPRDQTALVQRVAALRDVAVTRAAALAEGALRGSVLLASAGRPDTTMAALLGQSISGDLSRAVSDNPYRGGYAVHHATADYVEPDPFTAEEAACAFRLPLVFDDRDHGLPLRRHRTAPAQLPPVTGSATVLGLNRHAGEERPVAIVLPHRLRHTAVFGMTGCGKSTMLESMFLQDVRQGYGAAFIDPHGDSAQAILERFPEERAADLMVIDFEDRDRPIPMNLLAWRTLEERDLIIDELFSALLRVYKDPAMFGPIFEQYFRCGLKLLMGDKTGEFTATVLEFPKLFLDQKFRRYLLSRIDDLQVRDFAAEAERITYGDGKLENMAPYITNKFGRFLHDQLLSRILGHGAMALDFPAMLAGNRVLLIKLARGRFGANVSDLIAAQITARFRMAAMARPAGARRPYFLYVDEAGALAGDETLPRLLSESRKYGLGLVLAAQYAGQLREGGPARSMLSALLGNVGTLISYRVGAEDAPALAPLFAPSIAAQDLLECPNWQGYMRLHLDQGTPRPFSFHNQPDPEPPCKDRAARLIEASRRRWGVPAAECDENTRIRRKFIEKLD